MTCGKDAACSDFRLQLESHQFSTQLLLSSCYLLLSGTPQVLGSTPRGSEFQAEVKKIPSLALCAKALVVSRPQVGLRTLTWPRQVVPRGYVSQCQGGARVRGFSRSGKPSLLLDNTGGAVFPHPAEFFFNNYIIYYCSGGMWL